MRRSLKNSVSRPKIHLYTYLRGIDGRLPSDKHDETEKEASERGDKHNPCGDLRSGPKGQSGR